MGDPIKNIYDKYGLSKIGTYDQFKEALNDPTSRKNIHTKYLSNVGTYEQLTEVVNASMPKQQPIISSFQDPNRNSKDKGYRNNNPLNIKNNKGQFKVFNNLEEGYLASEKDLKVKLSGKSNAVKSRLASQGKGWGDATLADVILTWAPPSDNSKESLNNYINSVGKDLGVDPYKTHPTQIDARQLTIAMSKIESPDSHNALQQARKAAPVVPTQTPQPNISLSEQLEKDAKVLAEKKLNDKYANKGFVDRFLMDMNRTNALNATIGAISDNSGASLVATKLLGKPVGRLSATDSELMDAKTELLASGKYDNIKSPDELAGILNPKYKEKIEQTKIAEDKKRKSLEEDFNSNNIFDNLWGQVPRKKDANGNDIVGLNPQGVIDYGLEGQDFHKKEDVLKLTEHPAITKNKNKYNTREQLELNQHLRNIQADLTKAEQIGRGAATGITNDYLSYASKRAKKLEANLITKYGNLDPAKMSDEAKQKVANDPEYQQLLEIDQLRTKEYENLKQTSAKYKLAELNDKLAKEFNKKQDIKQKDFANLAWYQLSLDNKVLQNADEFVGDAVKAVAGSIDDTATLAGTLVDSALGTDIATSYAIDKAYNAEKIGTTAAKRGVLTNRTKLKDRDVYAIYDDNNEIVEFTDGNYFSLTTNPEDPLFKELKAVEKLSPEHGKPTTGLNSEALWHGIREPMIDMVPLIFGGGAVKMGLTGAATKIGVASRLGGSLNALANNSKFLTFAGSFAGFSGKMMDAAIKEGELVNSSDIFIATTAKTALEGLIETINPLEGRVFTDKLFSVLTTRQIKELSKIVAEEGTFKAIPIIAKKFGKELADNGLSEAMEEVIATIAEPTVVNKLLNATLDTHYDENFQVKDIFESALVGGLAGLAMGGIMEATPNAARQLANTDITRREVIRAGLQNKELFDKTINKQKEDLLNKAKPEEVEAIEARFEKIANVMDKAAKYSNSVFTEHPDTGHVPSSHIQTLYSNIAFEKAINENKTYTNSTDIKNNNAKIANADSTLKQLDLYIANNLDIFKSIDEMNLVPLDKKGKKTLSLMSPTELMNSNAELYEELEKATNAEKDSKYSDKQKIANITSKVQKKILEIKKKNDSKVDDAAISKVEEDAKLAAEEAKKESEAAKAIDKEAKDIEKELTSPEGIISTKFEERVASGMSIDDAANSLLNEGEDVKLIENAIKAHNERINIPEEVDNSEKILKDEEEAPLPEVDEVEDKVEAEANPGDYDAIEQILASVTQGYVPTAEETALLGAYPKLVKKISDKIAEANVKAENATEEDIDVINEETAEDIKKTFIAEEPKKPVTISTSGDPMYTHTTEKALDAAIEELQEDIDNIEEELKGNPITISTDYSVPTEGANFLAFLSRDYMQLSEVDEDGNIILSREEITNEVIQTNKVMLDPDFIKAGDTLVAKISDNGDTPMYDPTSPTKDLTTWAIIREMLKISPITGIDGVTYTYNDLVPIEIYTKDGRKTPAYVHTTDWISSQNIEPTHIPTEIRKLREIREQVIANDSLDIQVEYRTLGTLMKSKDGKAPVSEVAPGIDFVVYKNGEFEGTTGIDMTKIYQLQKGSFIEGVTYMVAPASNGKIILLPAWNNKLDENQVTSIHEAIKGFLGLNEKHKEFLNDNDVDVSSVKGLKDYLSLFINELATETASATKTVSAFGAALIGKPSNVGYFNIAPSGKGNFAIEFGYGNTIPYTITTNGKVFKGKTELSGVAAQDILNKKLPEVLGKMWFNTSLKNINKKDVKVPGVKGSTSEMLNDGTTYADYVRQNLSTNLIPVNIGTEGSPKYVFTIQPRIKFNPVAAKPVTTFVTTSTVTPVTPASQLDATDTATANASGSSVSPNIQIIEYKGNTYTVDTTAGTITNSKGKSISASSPVGKKVLDLVNWETQNEVLESVIIENNYNNLKVGQVLNVISKENPNESGTLTISEIESPNFIRFDVKFPNFEERLGYSLEDFNKYFEIKQLEPILITDIEKRRAILDSVNITIYQDKDGIYDVVHNEEGVIGEYISTLEEAIQVGEKWIAYRTTKPNTEDITQEEENSFNESFGDDFHTNNNELVNELPDSLLENNLIPNVSASKLRETVNALAGSLWYDSTKEEDEEGTITFADKFQAVSNRYLDLFKVKLDKLQRVRAKNLLDGKLDLVAINDNNIAYIQSYVDNWKVVEDNTKEFLSQRSQLVITDLLEDQTNEEDVETTRGFNEDIAFTIDNKKGSSQRIKFFLSFLAKPNKKHHIISKADTVADNDFNTYYEFDEVFNILEDLLALSNDQFVETSWIQFEKVLQSKAKDYAFITPLLDKINKEDDQIKKEFVKTFAKHHIPMYWVQFEKKSGSVNNLRIINANQFTVTKQILEKWKSKFNSSRFVTNKDGELILNGFVRSQLLPKFDSITNPNVDIPNILSALGLTLSQSTIDYIAENPVTIGGKRNVTWNSMATDLSKNSLLTILKNNLINYSKEDGPIDLNETHFIDNDNIFRTLATLESVNSHSNFSNSARIGNKTVSSFGNIRLFVQRFLQLKHDYNKTLSNLLHPSRGAHFSKPSLWGKMMLNPRFNSLFDYSYVSLEPLKKKGTKKQQSDLAQSGPVDYEKTKFALFQNNTTIKNGLRVARYMYSTMSDKKNNFLMTAPAFSIQLQGGFDLKADKNAVINIVTEEGNERRQLSEVLLDQLVLPEVNRMLAHSTDDINIEGYNPNLFYLVPEINNIKELFQESNGKRILKPDVLVNGKWNPEYKGLILDKIDTLFLDEILKTRTFWEKAGIGLIKDKFEFVDTEYIKYITSIAPVNASKQLLNNYMIIDYVVNYMLAEAQYKMLIQSDPALYYKSKSNIPVQQVLDTYDNLGKRLAADNGPRELVEHSSKEINVVAVNDPVVVSESIKFLTQVLDNKEITDEQLEAFYNMSSKAKKEFLANYPNSSPYFLIEGTDAQEYITWQHHLELLLDEGAITKKQYADLFYKIEGNKPLGVKDKKILFSARKPLYTANMLDSTKGIDRRLYIKTSTVPLLPQFTKGLQIDKIRQILESNPKNIKKFVYSTGWKVGAPTVKFTPFDVKGDVLDNLVIPDEAILTIPTDGYGKQQEVPDKKVGKNQIKDGSQPRKLKFQNIMEEVLDYMGKKISGKELRDIYTLKYNELYEIEFQELITELGGDISKIDIKNFANIILKEQSLRGSSISTKLAIETLQDNNFKLPLWANPEHYKIESLLNSIVNNRISKLSRGGRSYILASQEGFKGVVSQDDVNLKKSGIVFTDKWTGKLLSIRKDNGKIQKAQVLLPWKFKANLADYINKETGLLDSSKVPNDLLAGLGFRIPNHGHNTMMAFEVVGFLPENMGDIIIAPRDFTKQMGSDFDIDKLYSLLYNLEIGVDGTFYKVDEALSTASNAKKLRLQNELLEIDMSVITSDNPIVQKLVNTPLNFGLLDTLSKNPLYLKAQAKINSVLSPNYQRDKFITGASGKAGVGSFSLDLVFNAIVQGHNLLLNYIPAFKIDGLEPNINISNPYTLKTQRILRDKGIANDQVSEAITNGIIDISDVRFKSDVIVAYQTASVDNEKERILEKLNIQPETYNVIRALTSVGFDETDITNIIMQPAIVKYVTRLQEKSQSDDYTPNLDLEILDELAGEYVKKIGKVSDETILEKLSELNNKELEESINKENDLLQLVVLNLFQGLSDQGQTLRKVQTALNIDAAGIGKSIYEAYSKILDITEVLKLGVGTSFAPPVLSNLTTLFNPNNTTNASPINIASRLVNGLFFSKIFNGKALFPYRSVAFNNLLSELTEGEYPLIKAYKEWGKNKRTEFFKELFDNTKAFVWSTVLQQSGNNSSARKESLYKDTIVGEKITHKALGTIFSDLWDGKLIIKKESLTANEEKINRNILSLQNNKFLQMLTVVPGQGVTPTLIKTNASVSDPMDVNEIIKDFASLFNTELELGEINGMQYTTKTLFKDLVDYYIVGGANQQAVQFGKYIPMDYILDTYSNALNNFNFDNTDLLGEIDGEGKGPYNVSLFAKQFIQNNPNYAQVVNPEQIASSNSEKNVISNIEYLTLKGPSSPEEVLSYAKIEEGSVIFTQFITIDNGKMLQLYQYDPSINMYVRINNLNEQFITSYDAFNDPKAINSSQNSKANSVSVPVSSTKAPEVNPSANPVPVVTKELDYPKKGEGLNEVLSFIINNTPNANYKKLAIKFGEIVNKLSFNVKVDIDQSLDDLQSFGRVSSFYKVINTGNKSDITNRIQLGVRLKEQKKYTDDFYAFVALHEMQHLLTGDITFAYTFGESINNDPSLAQGYIDRYGLDVVNAFEYTYSQLTSDQKHIIKKLNIIHSKVKDSYINQGKTEQERDQIAKDIRNAREILVNNTAPDGNSEAKYRINYALSNLQEFMSVALTDKDFQEFLDNIGDEKSFLDRIITVITELYNTLVSGEKLSTEVMSEIIKLIETRKVDKTNINTPINKLVFGNLNIFNVSAIKSSDKKVSQKASIATQFIGFGDGIPNSSTKGYELQIGKTHANTGNYSANDIIFVSVVGKRGDATIRKEQQDKTIKEAIKALEAGSILITDNAAYLETSDYNEGEKRLAQNLNAKGYIYNETEVNGEILGVWSKNKLTNFEGADGSVVISENTKPNNNQRKYTPENITKLQPNQVFVFGANTAGGHGGGTAGLAQRGSTSSNYTALPIGTKGKWSEYGIVDKLMQGTEGKSFGIVTKAASISGNSLRIGSKRSVPLSRIEKSINALIKTANENPNLEFLVTKFGTNMAGFTEQEMKSLLENKSLPDNIILPKEFEVRNQQPTIISTKIESLPVVSKETSKNYKFYGATYKLNYDKDGNLIDIDHVTAGTGKVTSSTDKIIRKNIEKYGVDVDPQNPPKQIMGNNTNIGEDDYEILPGIQANADQKVAIDKIRGFLKSNDDFFLLEGGAGCLGYGTKVLMFDGTFKEVQDVIVGDQLMGIDSTPRNVLELKRGTEQMYNIIQNKGITYRVNENHILSLKHVIPAVNNHSKKVLTKNINLSEYLQLNETSKLRKHLKGYVSNAIEFNRKDVIIDPYYYGLWLGDGNTSNIRVITNTDQEIINYLTNTFGIKRTDGKITHTIDNTEYFDEFKNLYNLTNGAKLKEKYIHNNYLLNNINTRLQVLAGIIDSDGHYNAKNKYYEITLKHKQLADDVVFLTRSLGFKTTIKPKLASCNNCKEDSYLVYRITFSPECLIPTKIDYKTYKLDKSSFKNRLHTGFKVQKDIIDNYYGFVLDGDHLFMLEDFTVTHNTGKTSSINKALNSFTGKIIGATVSAEAKSILQQNMKGKDTKTIASLLGLVADATGAELVFRERNEIEERAFRSEGKVDPIETADLIVIDEASMVDKKTLALLKKLKPIDAKIIFLGDRTQLPPIGEVVSDVFTENEKTNNFIKLTKVERFNMNDPIFSITEDIYAERVRKNLKGENLEHNPIAKMKEDITTETEGVFFRDLTDDIYGSIAAQFTNAIVTGNPKEVVVIADRNDRVTQLNNKIRAELFGDNIPKYIEGEIISFKEPFVMGNIVMVENNVKGIIKKVKESTYNDVEVYAMQVEVIETNKNGEEQRRIQSINVVKDEAKYKAQLQKLANLAKQDKKVWPLFWDLKKAFANVGYGYAMTTHKVQGSTYNTVYVDMNDIYRTPNPRKQTEVNQMMRTATSRPRRNLVLMYQAYGNGPLQLIQDIKNDFPMSVKDLGININLKTSNFKCK